MVTIRWRRGRPGRSTWPSRTHRRAGVPDRGRRRLDRHGAGRLVRKVARRAGIRKTVTPDTLRHAFITAALDAGCRCAMSRRPPLRGPRTTIGTTGPRQRRPACDLHRGRVYPGRRPVTPADGKLRRAGKPAGGARRARYPIAARSDSLRPQREREPPLGATADLGIN